MSEELFLLSPNKARWCKLELITGSLGWSSKISFHRTTELSEPKSRQVIAHTPPRLLLLKWKFPKLCMHTHVATGTGIPSRGSGVSHKATAAAFLLRVTDCSPYKQEDPGGTAAQLALPQGKGPRLHSPQPHHSSGVDLAGTKALDKSVLRAASHELG